MTKARNIDYMRGLFLEMFTYSRETGELFWAVDRVTGTGYVCAHAGDRAGSMCRLGYWHVTVDQKPYLLHRVIFLMEHGYCPENLDHIDRNRSNNRLENLRPATPSENNANKPVRGGRKYKGVRRSWGNWRAEIGAGGRRIHIGTYATEQEAASAYNEIAKEWFGEFAWLNQVGVSA